MKRTDVVNGRTPLEIVPALTPPGDATYHPCPEASPSADTPRSTVTHYANWDHSEVFAGTKRDVWISVPPDFDPTSRPSVLIAQDGRSYLSRSGPVRATAVLDSLLAAGEIAPTVGVFVMPGAFEGSSPDDARTQRSIEYDTPDGAYPTFLIDELLPFVESEIRASLTDDPTQRTVMGISSGGICAFNAAWQRPESFGRVISHCGSFTNLRGGHEMAFWVRATPRKPIKVFLQTGTADAKIPQGNWTMANELMADSLDYAGYDYRFELGVGGHSLRHGGALFADTLRWLESDTAPRSTAQDSALFDATMAAIAGGSGAPQA